MKVEQSLGLDRQILMLNPDERKVHPEIAARAREILKKQVDFRKVKLAGPAATAFYVWVRTNHCI